MAVPFIACTMPSAPNASQPYAYLLLKRSRFTSFHYNLLVDSALRIAIFNTFVSCDPRFVHINVEETDSAVVATVSAVSAEA
jgi:hypothetical protein